MGPRSCGKRSGDETSRVPSSRWAWVFLLLACGEGSNPRPCIGSRCFSQEVRFRYEVQTAPALDLVVVVDDSPSLATRHARMQEKLRRAFEQSFGSLDRTVRPGLGDYDLEVRVISSTARVGDGSLPGCGAVPVADCPLPAEGVWRWNRFCGGPGPNFEDSLPSALACGARFSSTGCALEQPLAALAANLERGPPLRPDAFLFVLIVTDEDDCSFEGAPPFPVDPAVATADAPELSQRCRDADREGTLTAVSRYSELLRSLKRSDQDVHLSIIAGPIDAMAAPVGGPGGLCGSQGESVQAAPRLWRLVQTFGGRGQIFSFCAEDWSGALASVAQRFPIKLGTHCISSPLLDVYPDQPGLQADCFLQERVPSGPPRLLPACGSAGPPCWTLVPDPACGGGFSLEVDRDGCVAPRGTLLELTCAGDPMPPVL